MKKIVFIEKASRLVDIYRIFWKKVVVLFIVGFLVLTASIMTPFYGREWAKHILDELYLKIRDDDWY